jgi:hypothetical protein
MLASKLICFFYTEAHTTLTTNTMRIPCEQLPDQISADHRCLLEKGAVGHLPFMKSEVSFPRSQQTATVS